MLAVVILCFLSFLPSSATFAFSEDCSLHGFYFLIPLCVQKTDRFGQCA